MKNIIQYFSCGSFRSVAVYPNPATDVLTFQFDNPEIPGSLPGQIELYNESSTKLVKSILVQNAYNNNAFKYGNKVELDVKDLPRGTYYLHVIPDKSADQKIEKMRILLE